MAKIGTLLLDIQANVSKIKKDLERAERTLNGSLNKMERALKGFSVTVGAYFSTRAIANFLGSAVDAADQMHQLSIKTGISTETLSVFQHVANDASISTESLVTALRRTSRFAGEAAQGGKRATDAFKALGVEFQDASGLRSADEILLDIMDRFAEMPDGVSKVALAFKMFDTEGLKLIPFLNQGREGFERLKKEAEDLGIVISSQVAAQANAFNSALGRLGEAAQGVGLVIVQEALPYLLRITEWFDSAGRKGNEFQKGISIVFKTVATLATALWGVIDFVAEGIAGFLVGVFELLRGNFRQAYLALDAGGMRMIDSVTNAVTRIGDIWKGLPTDVDESVKKTNAATVGLLPAMDKVETKARNVAHAVEDSLLRMAQSHAAITKTQTDDILANYALQLTALRRKIDEEGVTMQERAAMLAEYAALEARRDKELRDAEERELREAEDRKRDLELEVQQKRAALSEDRYDDIVAWYDRELEALNRRLRDEKITEEEHLELVALLREEKEKQITEIYEEEVKKRQQAQERAYQQISTTLVSTFSDFVFAPLEDGFKSLEDAAKSLHRLVLSMMKDLMVAGIVKAITGTATGGIGGALLTVAGFSKGGYVGEGPGTETSDDILARLSKREYVVNARAVRRVGVRFLDWLNSLGDRPSAPIPAFARGGLVGSPGSAGEGGFGTGPVTVAPTFVVQAGGGLLHRQLLIQELGPALRQMAIEQMDNIIRQLGLNPSTVSSRG